MWCPNSTKIESFCLYCLTLVEGTPLSKADKRIFFITQRSDKVKDNHVVIKKFLEQRWLGYSPSTRKSYYRSKVETSDGIKTYYTDDKNHMSHSWDWSQYPYHPSDLIRSDEVVPEKKGQGGAE